MVCLEASRIGPEDLNQPSILFVYLSKDIRGLELPFIGTGSEGNATESKMALVVEN